MRLGVLFSGGKDSTLALHRASEFHKIVCLITLESENSESYMFHVPNIHITELQAKAMNIPLLKRTTHGEKERELEDLKKVLIDAKDKFEIDGLVTGAVRSVYQTTRIQKICRELDLWCFNPIWLEDEVSLLKEILEKKFEILVSGIFAYPLDRTFLGRKIDEELVSLLEEYSKKYKISPAGEGGELETTVLDAPMFKKRIEVLNYEIEYFENRGVFLIKEARLVEK